MNVLVSKIMFFVYFIFIYNLKQCVFDVATKSDKVKIQCLNVLSLWSRVVEQFPTYIDYISIV